MTLVRKLPKYKPLFWVFEQMRHERLAVFLDSSLKSELGRYSIAGLRPYTVLEERGDTVLLDGSPLPRTFDAALDNLLAQRAQENETALPLIDGAIGFLSYEHGRAYEGITTRHTEDTLMPDALFAFYDLLLIEDHTRSELWACAQGQTESTEDAWNRALHLVAHASAPATVPKHSLPASYEADFAAAEYEQTIAKLIDYIEAGETYVANMTQRLRVRSNQDPYAVYRYLHTNNPAPFSAFFNGGDWSIVCASMERFLFARKNHVVTRPIKGTRKRGQTLEEDLQFRRQLESDPKERSELLMIVDLERNDLSRVCTCGSVQVPEHCVVEEYATVYHLVSTVVGELRENATPSALLRAMFPGGSITGAPKIRTMQIIDELERSRRGLYTGSIGYFSSDKSCDLNIVIRTAVYECGVYTIGVGGGVTYESDPRFEHEETLLKARVILEALGK